MRSTRKSGRRHRRGGHLHRRGATVVALMGLLTLWATPTTSADPGTGFSIPFSGAPDYEHLAPTQVTEPSQLHAPLGQQRADDIARQIGLSPEDALSEQQARDLTSGGGVGGSREAADIINACVDILTNTTGRPLYSDIVGESVPSTLASYGLYVNPDGLLQSPANADAPTRQVNTLIAPGGYVGNWLRDNGATRTLIALYRSAYTVQAVYGFAAQQISGSAQLVTNTKDGVESEVGMSMAPPLWIVNFALIYVVDPALAAAMPAYWAPIPPEVVEAVKASPTGQVPYADYASYLE
ncbi:hypothetical protein [Rhodococcus sp. B50]|uniref:hypothetical protein n=1 Tax=Rhodococcus sp. B50 TaxID=2682847 RepID=UPI001BD43787|nr:hypothetical protein [Rhodococcus sp. B50]MBS9375344.1 hypothetical protein [Rhodococcus sp. B50]